MATKSKEQTQRYYFKVDPEIYERYVFGKYRSFMHQLNDFLTKMAENPNCKYSYGKTTDCLTLNMEESSGVDTLDDYLIEAKDRLAKGCEEEYTFEMSGELYKYFMCAVIDNSVFTINAVNKDGNKCTNKKRANRMFKNFYNADNANGLKDFIERALFKNGINHNFCVTTYNSNEEVFYTYHLADNLSMTVGVFIPDVSIKNADAKTEDYFTTMNIYCSLDVTGYNVNLMGMIEE